MGGNPGTGEEYLYCGLGETHIHLLLDVLIRHGIIHALRADMVVILGGGHFPDCQLKRCSRKRQQEQFLLRKASCPAALPFLKGLVVECFQFLMDCFIQFRKGQELTVTQSRQDPGGGHANGPLHKSLVFGTAGTGRENGGTVVLRHLLIGLVEHCFRSGILHHAGLEVIRREDAGDAAEISVGVDMTGDPASCRQDSFARLEINAGKLPAATWTELAASQVFCSRARANVRVTVLRPQPAASTISRCVSPRLFSRRISL